MILTGEKEEEEEDEEEQRYFQRVLCRQCRENIFPNFPPLARAALRKLSLEKNVKLQQVVLIS